MAELATLADIGYMQRTAYPKEVTRPLYVMAQAKESSPFIDLRSNYCATPPTLSKFTFLWIRKITKYAGIMTMHRK